MRKNISATELIEWLDMMIATDIAAAAETKGIREAAKIMGRLEAFAEVKGRCKLMIEDQKD